ncbi:hypothetical protein BZM27_47805 [Paraburkholderia steynii]|uniref:Uncharacterized protein n=1 Tax=Paraburkholderia steynii TaxID=1245441 RepID=A0A4R0XA14_9BURK|nr:hypothetical protein BZM27_47805 [Paraburkholderia steynii]
MLKGIEENDDIEMTAEALLAYLNSPALNAFGSERVSGAAEGIVVRLHGELDTPELCDFADVLTLRRVSHFIIGSIIKCP